jgi:hypothetical protein
VSRRGAKGSIFSTPCVHLEVEIVGAMEVKGREIGPDDAKAALERPSLYELANIDRDRYTIVGVDVGVDGPTTAIVYVIDRLEHSIAELGRSGGEIPVVGFSLPEPKIEDFIRQHSTRSS